MVKGALMLAPREKLELKVPLALMPPVRVCVPVAVYAPELDTVRVVFTVRVVLLVAACAAAQHNRAIKSRDMLALSSKGAHPGAGPSELAGT